MPTDHHPPAPRPPEQAHEQLARRYRRLLFAYPPGYRHARGGELLCTLLDVARPGQTRPDLADAADLVLAGARERLRRPLATGAGEGLRLAAPYALGLAGALSVFVWLVIEPVPGRYATFGPYLTVGPLAYAGWLLALAGYVTLPTRWARRGTALATVLTALLVPLGELLATARPPLWVVCTLLGLGALALAGPPPRPAGATARLSLGSGALLAAALAKALLVAWLPDGASPWLGYYQPSLYLAGLLFGAVVLGLGVTGLVAAFQGGTARPWLWAALLLALPGGWLGPGPVPAWSTGVTPGFGRLAEVLTSSVAVIAAMTFLVPRGGGAVAPASGLRRAGSTALGVAAGLSGVVAPLFRWLPPASVATLATGWLVAVLLGCRPGRAARSAAALAGLAGTAATVAVGGVPALLTGTLALLGVVALATSGVPVGDGQRGARGYPLLVAGLTAAGALVVVAYDNDWRAHWPAPSAMALLVTLAVVPFGRTALAGLRALPDSGLRPAGALAAGTALVWLAALTLPHLPAWGPVLLALSLGAAAAAILGVTRQAAGSWPRQDR